MKTDHDFLPARASVPAVRKFVLDVVTRLPDEVVDRVMLIVSELATNAVVHAGSGFTVGVELDASMLRIEMSDSGEGVPEMQPLQPPTAIHGRGLQIVDFLSDRWGTVYFDPGNDKTIWVEVDLDRTTRRAFRS